MSESTLKFIEDSDEEEFKPVSPQVMKKETSYVFTEQRRRNLQKARDAKVAKKQEYLRLKQEEEERQKTVEQPEQPVEEEPVVEEEKKSKKKTKKSKKKTKIVYEESTSSETSSSEEEVVIVKKKKEKKEKKERPRSKPINIPQSNPEPVQRIPHHEYIRNLLKY